MRLLALEEVARALLALEVNADCHIAAASGRQRPYGDGSSTAGFSRKRAI